MKSQKNKLTKIGMVLLMAVASALNTEKVKGQIYCDPPSIGPTVLGSPVGNFGIRTDKPLSSFHLGLNPSASTNYIAPYPPQLPDPALQGLLLQSYESSDAYKRFSDIVALGYGNGGYGGSTLRFLTNNSNSGTAQERMRIEKDGNVGIGSTAPTQKLHIHDGAIMVSGMNPFGGPMILFSDDLSSKPNGRWGIEYEPSAGGLNFWNPYNGGSNPNPTVNYNLFLKDNGNIGIATSTPLYNLHVAGLGNFYTERTGSGNQNNALYIGMTSNALASATLPAGTVNFISKNLTPGVFPDMTFSANNTDHQLIIKNNGKVGIGINPSSCGGNPFPGNYKLYVKDGIMTEKVKVAVACSANWADHVFADDYKLKSLDEVEAFVTENNHLPGVPSANELVKEGLDLGEMQAKQMEKIEELTLYMIEMKKEIDQLKKANAALQITNTKN